MTSLKMKVVMEKSDAKDLQGKSLSAPGSEGGVTLPTSLNLGNPEESIVVQVRRSVLLILVIDAEMS